MGAKTPTIQRCSIFKFSNLAETVDENPKPANDESSKDIISKPVVPQHERTASFINKLPTGLKENFLSKRKNLNPTNFLNITENIQEIKAEEDKESSSSSSTSSASILNPTSQESISEKGCINLQPINESIEINSEEPQLSKAEYETETVNTVEKESVGASRKTTADSPDKIKKQLGPSQSKRDGNHQ